MQRYLGLLVIASCLSALTPAVAEQAKRVGYLALIPGEDRGLMQIFLVRLGELGWRQGTNLQIEYRTADGAPEKLHALAAEIVAAKPDLIVTGLGTLTALAAKKATGVIPIIFTAVGDPLGAKVVDRLDKPGANITGVSTQIGDLGGKRLQLILELAGRDKPVAVLRNPQTPLTAVGLREITTAARAINHPVVVFEATSLPEVRSKFEAAAAAGAGSIIVLEDPLIFSAQNDFAALIKRHQLVTMFGDRRFVQSGGLLSYGPDRQSVFRLAAEYTDKVLRGQKPGDLPVQQPTKFELVINLRTAEAMGLKLPDRLIAIADEVIE